MNKTLGWNRLWFLPLCIAVLVVVELYQIIFDLTALGVATRRWSWSVLISPSAYFCITVMFEGLYLPIRALMLTSVTVTTHDASISAGRRYLYAALLAGAIFLIPFVTQALVWGSFPFGVDNDRNIRLRMIPFIPWPEGHFGDL
jgi:hypothetical protein